VTRVIDQWFVFCLEGKEIGDGGRAETQMLVMGSEVMVGSEARDGGMYVIGILRLCCGIAFELGRVVQVWEKEEMDAQFLNN
jgi:hypothetical protein